MSDYIVLFGLVIFLGIYYRLDKKNLEDYFYKAPYDRFNAIRLYLVLIGGVILMIFKIIL
ncbi:hypothetical protein NAT51_07980 [Flavobacterium amniphilum]|nr:hypothetical protein [Flavobacterium amniphilum]